MSEETLGGEHLGCHRISPRKANVGMLGQDMGLKEKEAPQPITPNCLKSDCFN